MLGLSKKKLKLKVQKGFTLVELIVVITILGGILALTLAYINPLSQLNKFNDAKRREDLRQIRTALDSYYNDTSCFPDDLIFGYGWSENGATYMKEVPQDVDCSQNPASCYVYVAPGNCSQWSVVFAKLANPPQSSACALSSLSGCTPQGYDSSWACEITGSVDCDLISSTNITASSSGSVMTPTPTPTILPTTPTPTSIPTSTPTPTPLSCTPRNYSCTGNPARCNVVPDGTGTYCNSACNGAC